MTARHECYKQSLQFIVEKELIFLKKRFIHSLQILLLSMDWIPMSIFFAIMMEIKIILNQKTVIINSRFLIEQNQKYELSFYARLEKKAGTAEALQGLFFHKKVTVLQIWSYRLLVGVWDKLNEDKKKLL